MSSGTVWQASISETEGASSAWTLWSDSDIDSLSVGVVVTLSPQAVNVVLRSSVTKTTVKLFDDFNAPPFYGKTKSPSRLHRNNGLVYSSQWRQKNDCFLYKLRITVKPIKQKPSFVKNLCK